MKPASAPSAGALGPAPERSAEETKELNRLDEILTSEAKIFEIPKRRRPTAEDNERLVEMAKFHPKMPLGEIMLMAEYPATELTAKKRLKEANVKLKPQKKNQKKKASRQKIWHIPGMPLPNWPVKGKY